MYFDGFRTTPALTCRNSAHSLSAFLLSMAVNLPTTNISSSYSSTMSSSFSGVPTSLQPWVRWLLQVPLLPTTGLSTSLTICLHAQCLPHLAELLGMWLSMRMSFLRSINRNKLKQLQDFFLVHLVTQLVFRFRFVLFSVHSYTLIYTDSRLIQGKKISGSNNPWETFFPGMIWVHLSQCYNMLMAVTPKVPSILCKAPVFNANNIIL